jgi:hypothetical protein
MLAKITSRKSQLPCRQWGMKPTLINRLKQPVIINKSIMNCGRMAPLLAWKGRKIKKFGSAKEQEWRNFKCSRINLVAEGHETKVYVYREG